MPGKHPPFLWNKPSHLICNLSVFYYFYAINKTVTTMIYRFTIISDEVDDFVREIQEATGNALKHAQATHIKIILVREGNRIKLTIADNGKGFELQTGKSGIGLVIIKERVENLKGVLTLSSVPGKGTDVIVEIDLDGLEK